VPSVEQHSGDASMDIYEIISRMMAMANVEFQVTKGNNLLACAQVSPLSERATGNLKAKLMEGDYASYKQFMQKYTDALLEKCKLGNELWRELCGGDSILTMSDSDIRKTTLVVDGRTIHYPQKYNGSGSNVSIILPYKLERYPEHTLLFTSYENGNFSTSDSTKSTPKYLIDIWNTICR
jgi:hypothetical protein